LATHANKQLSTPEILPLTPVQTRRKRRAGEAAAAPPVNGAGLPPATGYLAFKAIFELGAALLLALVAAPAVALAALLIKLTSRGPAFYTQLRVGRNGQLFTIFKLRTMIHDCESLTGPRWAIRGDPRVTAIGHVLRATHLDELPQLLNVLRGDMGLIGPRPERPEFVRELDRIVPGYRRRLVVRPGVTGLAQVHLGADTDVGTVRRKLLYDLFYIDHLSVWMDVRILLGTVVYVLGNPWRLTRRWRLVPGPEIIERSAQEPGPAEAPSIPKLCA
jgi:lipopolysaccharide/colanic/teichoic acid biosynthesis glycosyltransferase